MENINTINSEESLAIQAELDKIANRKKVMSEILPFGGLIFIFIFFLIVTGGKIVSPSNLENLINQSFTIAVVSVGAAFVYAHGGIDFSIGAVSGVAQLVMGLILTQTGLPFGVALLGSILVGLISSAIVGGVSMTLGVPVFIASLCMRTIAIGILSTVLSNSEIVIPYTEYRFMNSTPLKAVILVIVILLGIYLFEYTRIGKSEKAIGENILTTSQSGIKTNKLMFLGYLFLGLCVGLVSIFSLFRTGVITAQAGNGLEFNVMLAIVLGGFPMTGGDASKIRSVIIGAITITLLTNGLIIWGLDPGIVNGIKGVLFLIIVGLSYDRSKGNLIS
jgi:ribose transport system permease protein